MRHKRQKLSRRKSKKQFRKGAKYTRRENVRSNPMRGGFRL